MRRRIKWRPAASRFMRTSCQDVIKLQQRERENDAMDGGGKKENEKIEREREDIAEEVADATNEVEINVNFREERPGHKAPLRNEERIRAKGPRGKLSQRTTTKRGGRGE